ncbi:MAG: hypothetical protein IT371_24425 [Deltaproteobacteria bacterium]|nr:hypothetical protein [Deltaproteobacteria bacterium]
MGSPFALDRRRPRGWRSLALVLCAGALFACPAHQSGSSRDDEGGDGESEGEGDGEGSRERESRRVPVLIDAKRLPDAVVEQNRTGKPRDDLESLRQSLCEGREDERVVFYQLVVSTHWHYYWVCGDKKAQRAATEDGDEKLRSWVKRLEKQAAAESAGCAAGSRQRLFKQTHESGTRVKAYCDGQLVLRFPDGGKKTVAFASQAPAGSGPAAGGENPDAGDAADGDGDGDGAAQPATQPPVVQAQPPATGRRGGACPPCAACPACPAQRPCPPQRACPAPPPCPACPACDCSTKAREAGEKGFWQGVQKACKRICTLVYQKCRAINPSTALCYQVAEYCAGACDKK